MFFVLIIIFSAAIIAMVSNNSLGAAGSFRLPTERVDSWSVLCSLSFEVFTVRCARWEYNFPGHNTALIGNLLPKLRRSLLTPSSA